MDRFRINPIPITKETKNLFQYLDTQQLFEYSSDEIILEKLEILQINKEINFERREKLKNEIDKKNWFVKNFYSHIKTLINVFQTMWKLFLQMDFKMLKWHQLKFQLQFLVWSFKPFCHCPNLKEIVIPNSVTRIEDECFRHCCELTKVVLSTNIVKLKEKTFVSCESLKIIEFPCYLTKIGLECFQKCNFEEIINSSSIKIIGKCEFRMCTNLTRVDFS